MTAYVWPLSLNKFSDIIRVQSSKFDIQRNDELSGSGSGRFWQAELAPPIWMAKVELSAHLHAEARQIAAVMRKFEGSKNPFLLADQTALYPQNDPKGLILGSNTVTVSAVQDSSISLAGLPGGYQLTIGDRGSISFDGGDKYYYFEFSETAYATGGGNMPGIEVFPYPSSVIVGRPVVLKKPAAKMIIMPGTLDTGTNIPGYTAGAKFDAIEKKA